MDFAFGNIAARRRSLTAVGLVAAAVALGACQDAPGKNIAATVDQSLRQGGAQAEAARGWQEAAATYRSLYQRNPDDRDAALGLMRSLRQGGHADEAVNIGATVTARHPDDAGLVGEYGKARLAARDLAGALETLGKAATLAPEDWSLRSALGVARDLRGEHDLAQAAYLEALELSPGNPSVTNNLALSLALTGNLDGAIARLETLAPPMRGSTQARQSLALLYALKGETAKAEPLIRRDLPERLAGENLAYLRQLEGEPPRPAAASAEIERTPVASAPSPGPVAALPRRAPRIAATPASVRSPAVAEAKAAPDLLATPAQWAAVPDYLAGSSDPRPEIAALPEIAAPEPEAAPAATPAPPRHERRKRAAPPSAIASSEPASVPAPPVAPPAAAMPELVSAPIGAPPAEQAAPSPAAPSWVAQFRKRGDQMLATGDLAAARLFYERAADAGDGRAAFALARTYDAAFLGGINARGVAADAAKAAEWYGVAERQGAGTAPAHPAATSPETIAAAER